MTVRPAGPTAQRPNGSAAQRRKDGPGAGAVTLGVSGDRFVRHQTDAERLLWCDRSNFQARRRPDLPQVEMAVNR